jgi:tRNA A22 N-methylase
MSSEIKGQQECYRKEIKTVVLSKALSHLVLQPNERNYRLRIILTFSDL